MQCAMIALMASGYRPSANVPGHHQTMIQSLELMLRVPKDDWIVLDALRRKRNLNDYTGDPIDTTSVRECVARAEILNRLTRSWLSIHHAELVEPNE